MKSSSYKCNMCLGQIPQAWDGVVSATCLAGSDFGYKREFTSVGDADLASVHICAKCWTGLVKFMREPVCQVPEAGKKSADYS